eukprot:8818887-Pyramimonas_sp.AAC.1
MRRHLCCAKLRGAMRAAHCAWREIFSALYARRSLDLGRQTCLAHAMRRNLRGAISPAEAEGDSST